MTEVGLRRHVGQGGIMRLHENGSDRLGLIVGEADAA